MKNVMTAVHMQVVNDPLWRALAILAIAAVALSSTGTNCRADNSTWNLNPISEDWDTAANWTPNVVPADMATFSFSNVTNVSISAFSPVHQINYDADASPYTITVLPDQVLEFSAEVGGITNNSGVTQNIILSADNSGRSGNCLAFGRTVNGPVLFTNQASMIAGGNPGAVSFQLGSASGNATFHNLGAAVSGAIGGVTDFSYTSSADESTLISYGGTVSGARGGETSFSFNTPTAGNAILIAYGGTNGGDGGSIQFSNGATGGTARVEVFGNGYLNMSGKNGPSLTIGSLEGDGQVYLGRVNLSVGSNSLSTTFSGVLNPGSPGGGTGGTGALTKIGSGTLTLTGANLYTAGTVITEGTLVVSNAIGSGTGTAAVQVNAGTLGGSGIISGAVTVGTGNATGAFLAPAHGTKKQVTLTIQSALTYKSDSTYTYTFKAKGNKSKTDKVVANGVTINSGATFNLSGTAQGTLNQGTILTVIKNTAATPISGTFSNLADGAIVNVNGNNLQASYTGGDGNDLTLTVVP
jgi:fibronectin-binding autotransporter adhesin